MGTTLTVPGDVQDVSDGYHTFRELYEYRMLYNAHAARGWLAAGFPVVKSRRHSDGDLCFGGGWFIVVAELPAGQVSNHYREEHWHLFDVPAVDLPPAYDGHTPADAAGRLRARLPRRPPMTKRTGAQGRPEPRRTIPNEDEPQNWQEDFRHENGQYLGQCSGCGRDFLGHKRRRVCRLCAPAPHGEPPRPEPKKCGRCRECLKDEVDFMGFPVLQTRFVVCPECGNKRCPKATDHRHACTGSNEPGQPGSVFGGMRRAPAPSEGEPKGQLSPFALRGADRLARAALAAIDRGHLDARSEIGDALLDYADDRFGVSDGSGVQCLRATPPASPAPTGEEPEPVRCVALYGDEANCGCVGRCQDRDSAPAPSSGEPEGPLVSLGVDDWSEEDGPVLWWRFPVEEPPYVGTPLDDDWPPEFDRWTPIVVPADGYGTRRALAPEEG